MTIAVGRLFNHNWSVVWATTYTCGVVEFDEYFLGQLRPDDLNVTILADLGALTETWSAMKETSGPSRLRRVNRAYLLRPVAWYGHAFHPKTYLFGNEHVGLLLVGSGNHNLAQGPPVGRFYQRLGRTPLRGGHWWERGVAGLDGRTDHRVVQQTWQRLYTGTLLSWFPFPRTVPARYYGATAKGDGLRQ